MQSLRKAWIRLALSTAAVIAAIIARNVLWPDLGPEDLRGAIAATASWAPAVFVGAHTFGALLPIPVHLFAFVSGTLFPLPEAFLWTWLGLQGAAQMQFLLGCWGGDAFRRRLRQRLPETMAQFDDHRLPLLLAFRALPVVPFGLTNYAFVVAGVPWRTYTAATAVGLVPGAVAFTFAGAAFGGFDAVGSTRFWVVLGGLAASLVGTAILGIYILRRHGTDVEAWLGEED